MAQSFSFGFNNDDIEDEADEGHEMEVDNEHAPDVDEEPGLIEPRLHSLDELLSHLPSSIAYTTHLISPYSSSAPAIRLPRRELYDIRAQLMAEEEPTGLQNPLLAGGLSADDITPKIYEGGFKTWECATDLARYLAGAVSGGRLELEEKEIDIIELGAGTALPTLTLLTHLLTHPTPPSSTPPKINITLADYNPTVLSLSTIPNLLLTWASCCNPSNTTTTTTTTTSRPISPHHQGDLEISPPLISSFTTNLTARNIHVAGISGAWGPSFVDLLNLSSSPISKNPDPQDATTSASPSTANFNTNTTTTPNKLTILLASETIYSPSTLPSFTHTLLSTLSRASNPFTRTLALIAAKRIYFGVGGGVDEFLSLLEGMGGWGRCVWDSGADEGGEGGEGGEDRAGGGAGGVGRCILEVGVR